MDPTLMYGMTNSMASKNLLRLAVKREEKKTKFTKLMIPNETNQNYLCYTVQPIRCA